EGAAVEAEGEGEGTEAEAEGEGAAVEAEGEGEGTEAEAEGEGEGTEAEAEGEAAAVEAEGEGAAAEAEGEGTGADGEGAEGGEGEGAAAEGEGEGEGAAAAAEGESEGGAAATDPAADRLLTLALIEARLRAAMALHDAGEAEAATAMTGEAAEGAEYDLTGDEAQELYHAIEDAKPDHVGDLLDKLQAARGTAPEAKRLAALAPALRLAGDLYAAAMSDGTVSDLEEYRESWALVQVARAEADSLAGSQDTAVAGAAKQVAALLDDVAPAYGDLDGQGIATADASLLHATAARVELAALKLQ
ncbi:MAG: hypothetical protein ACU0AT_11310, partial [Tranquillimonas sp.]